MSSSTQPISVGCVFFPPKGDNCQCFAPSRHLGMFVRSWSGSPIRGESSRVGSLVERRFWSFGGFDQHDLHVYGDFFWGGPRMHNGKPDGNSTHTKRRRQKASPVVKFPAKKMRVILHVYMMVWFLGLKCYRFLFWGKVPMKSALTWKCIVVFACICLLAW